MSLYVIFIFVIQILYCFASSSPTTSCECSKDVALPVYAVILLGITIATLFFSTVALGMIVYRQKIGKGSEQNLFGNNRHVSISKYERQLSGNSLRSSFGINGDTEQLNRNENESICHDDDTHIIEADACEVKVEKESKSQVLPKGRQPKVPIFPQMPEEQMNAICQAVLEKHRMKESTSLSDLDKIINDANEQNENSKKFDISASTPDLDVYDVLPSPLPFKKVPVFQPNSIEIKLQEEMKAKFKKYCNNITAKVEKDENLIKSEINEVESKCNLNEHENKSGGNLENKSPKFNQAEFNSKLIRDEIESKQDESKIKDILDEILSKSNKDEVKPNVKPEENIQHKSGETAKPGDEIVVQDDIYDCPPPPRAENDIYDFPPSPRSHDEIYETPPLTMNRNLIVSDGNATGYLVPLSGSDIVLLDEPQYTNAKSVPDPDRLGESIK